MTQTLIITGFHRSGTSVTAHVLHNSGLFLGDKLLGVDFSNPYGHFEDAEVIRLHDGLLADCGRDWTVAEPFVPTLRESRIEAMRNFIRRRQKSHAVWGFKDPRSSLFCPLWKTLIPQAKVLVVIRHYSSCYRSLLDRHSANVVQNRGPFELHLRFWEEPELALRMWLTYNRALIDFVSSEPNDVLVISYDQLRAGLDVVHEVKNSLGIRALTRGPSPLDPNATSSRVQALQFLPRALLDEADRVWGRLLEQVSIDLPGKEPERAVERGQTPDEDLPNRLDEVNRLLSEAADRHFKFKHNVVRRQLRDVKRDYLAK